MSKTIRTYNDLCEERERLQNQLVVQKQRMKDDWDGLKHELNPFKKVAGVFGKMTRPDKSNPLMNTGVKVVTDLFITKFVLGKAGWLTKALVPLVLKNYSTHVIADKGKNFVSRISTFLNNKKKYGVREHVRATSVKPLETTGTGPYTSTSPASTTIPRTNASDNTTGVGLNREVVSGQNMTNREISDDLRQAATNSE